jgi:hypothetical protein
VAQQLEHAHFEDTEPSSPGPSERQPLRPPDSGVRARRPRGMGGVWDCCHFRKSAKFVFARCWMPLRSLCWGLLQKGALAGTQRTPAFSVRCRRTAYKIPQFPHVDGCPATSLPALPTAAIHQLHTSFARLLVCQSACLLACICGTHLFHYPGLACVLGAS